MKKYQYFILLFIGIILIAGLTNLYAPDYVNAALNITSLGFIGMLSYFLYSRNETQQQLINTSLGELESNKNQLFTIESTNKKNEIFFKELNRRSVQNYLEIDTVSIKTSELIDKLSFVNDYIQNINTLALTNNYLIEANNSKIENLLNEFREQFEANKNAILEVKNNQQRTNEQNQKLLYEKYELLSKKLEFLSSSIESINKNQLELSKKNMVDLDKKITMFTTKTTKKNLEIIKNQKESIKSLNKFQTHITKSNARLFKQTKSLDKVISNTHKDLNKSIYKQSSKNEKDTKFINSQLKAFSSNSEAQLDKLENTIQATSSKSNTYLNKIEESLNSNSSKTDNQLSKLADSINSMSSSSGKHLTELEMTLNTKLNKLEESFSTISTDINDQSSTFKSIEENLISELQLIKIESTHLQTETIGYLKKEFNNQAENSLTEILNSLKLSEKNNIDKNQSLHTKMEEIILSIKEENQKSKRADKQIIEEFEDIKSSINALFNTIETTNNTTESINRLLAEQESKSVTQTKTDQERIEELSNTIQAFKQNHDIINGQHKEQYNSINTQILELKELNIHNETKDVQLSKDVLSELRKNTSLIKSHLIAIIIKKNAVLLNKVSGLKEEMKSIISPLSNQIQNSQLEIIKPIEVLGLNNKKLNTKINLIEDVQLATNTINNKLEELHLTNSKILENNLGGNSHKVVGSISELYHNTLRLNKLFKNTSLDIASISDELTNFIQEGAQTSHNIASISSKLHTFALEKDQQNIEQKENQINAFSEIEKKFDLSLKAINESMSSKINEHGSTIQKIHINSIINQLNKPPIIIGGCGRSGTTLLLSILGAHPNILAIPEETKAFCPTAYNRVKNPLAEFDIDKFVGQYISQLQLHPTHNRWCEKTPKNIMYVERILEHFGPKVKFIHIVRDPRDVVLSKHPNSVKNKSWIEPTRWVKDVSNGIKYKDNKNVLTINYEDLVLDFEDTMKKVCSFLEIEYSQILEKWYLYTNVKSNPAWFEDAQPIYTDSVGRWKKRKSSTSYKKLMANKKAVSLMKKLNYL
jgi:hypothetical protein